MPLRILIRRYYLWKNRSRHRYKLDRRQYRGAFRAGFFAYLGGSRFWEASNDRFRRRRWWRIWLKRLFFAAALILLGYIIMVSIQGADVLSD